MKTVAIVEDNPDNLLLLRVLLQEHYQLREYTDGTAAVSGIIANPPHLVLMDISLPDICGVDILEKIREQESTAHLPVIAITAHAMLGDKEKILALGFNFYISKPIVEPSQLLAPIARLINPDRRPQLQTEA
ncbi:MAG: response regulator [Xanthomonadales bacterium]|nr:response regulator [Xanthomonadales bacterium]